MSDDLTQKKIDLFRAILAMDSYNRGYDVGIKVRGSQLGNARIINRESLGIDNEKYQTWISSGFYAIAYEWNGETIISIRGTDNLNPFSSVVLR